MQAPGNAATRGLMVRLWDGVRRCIARSVAGAASGADAAQAPALAVVWFVPVRADVAAGPVALHMW
jgi:hypothetical protein